MTKAEKTLELWRDKACEAFKAGDHAKAEALNEQADQFADLFGLEEVFTVHGIELRI